MIRCAGPVGGLGHPRRAHRHPDDPLTGQHEPALVADDPRALDLHERARAPGFLEVVGVGDVEERPADQLRGRAVEQAAHRGVARRDHPARGQHRHADGRVVERAEQVLLRDVRPVALHRVLRPPTSERRSIQQSMRRTGAAPGPPHRGSVVRVDPVEGLGDGLLPLAVAASPRCASSMLRLPALVLGPVRRGCRPRPPRTRRPGRRRRRRRARWSPRPPAGSPARRGCRPGTASGSRSATMPPSTFSAVRSTPESAFIASSTSLLWKAVASSTARAMWPLLT